MAYQCPRCGDAVSRGSSKAAQMAVGGVAGALVGAAFSSFVCQKCGKIPRREFPDEVRSRMLFGSLGLVAGAIVLVVVVIGIIASMK